MLVEKVVADDVCRIILNRPQSHNTLTKDMIEELSHTLVKADKDVRVLILEGAGKSFCSGADMNGLFDMSFRQLKSFAIMGKKVCAQLEAMKVPTIAVLKGHTLGEGIELALCCDFRIASDKTTFEFPQIRHGYTPGFGATSKLPKLLGRARALELLISGLAFDAKTACALGLVTQCVSDKQLQKKVDHLVSLIMKRHPLAVAAVKQLVHSGDFVKETSYFAEQLSMPDTKLNIKELLGGK